MSIAPTGNVNSLQHFQAACSRLQDSSLAGSAYQTRQSSITMKTAEGDVITISSTAAAGFNLNLDQTQVTDSSSISFTATLLKQSSLQISVQGDLNDEELADMKKLLQDLHKVSTTFYAGNMDVSLKHAMAIGDMGSISELQASFQYASYAAASYSGNYHPVPDRLTAGLQQQDPVAGDLLQGSSINVNDLLQAQWQQLQNFLQADTTGSADQPAEPSQPGKMSLGDLLQSMQQLLDDAISKHPRLSPLAVPLAAQALGDAASQQQVPEATAVNSDRAILLQLQSWLLA